MLSFELLKMKADEILSLLKRGEIDLGILALALYELSLKEESIILQLFGPYFNCNTQNMTKPLRIFFV